MAEDQPPYDNSLHTSAHNSHTKDRRKAAAFASGPSRLRRHSIGVEFSYKFLEKLPFQVSSSFNLHSTQSESATTAPPEATTAITDNVSPENEEEEDVVTSTEAIEETLQEASDSVFTCPGVQPQCAVRIPKAVEEDPTLMEEG